MRLFVACDLPEDIKRSLQKILETLPPAELKPVRDFHLTLQFLGEVSSNTKRRVKEALTAVPFGTYCAQLAALRTFGKGAPRVVWIGVILPPDFFAAVSTLVECLAPLGFVRQEELTPHVTLARIVSVADPRSFTQALERCTVPPKEFTISRFYLYESVLAEGGARHTKLASFPREQKAHS